MNTKSIPMSALLLGLVHCSTPPPVGDGSVPTDAAAGETGLATREPVYPTSPPVRCGNFVSNTMIVPEPRADCLPWVGFGVRHDQDPTKRMVGASACAQVLVLDPVRPSQEPGINMLPEGRTLVPGGLTVVGTIMAQQIRSVNIFAQMGNGIEFVQMGAVPGSGLVVTPANETRFRFVEPGAQIVAELGGRSMVSMDGGELYLVTETPVAQPDGTYLVQRRLGSTSNSLMARYDLTPIRRRTSAPQQEGITARGVGPESTIVTCAVADGKILVDFQTRDRAYAAIEYDTGDSTLQRCTIANINGSFVGVAASQTRSVAFTAVLGRDSREPPSVIRPYPLQPYFLPVNRAELGLDQGPFAVSLFGSNELLPSGLGIYTRQAPGAATPQPVFAFLDRNMDYDSEPSAPVFRVERLSGDERYTAAIWPTGQIAVARYSPTSGMLAVATANCTR